MMNDNPLASNGLPQRWAARGHFVVLETGFGSGWNFLATWAAWRADPQRCRTLYYIAIEAHPPSADELIHAHRDGNSASLVTQLVDAWPALTPNLHRIDLETGRVQLLLVVDELGNGLREVVADVDAFYLDRPCTTLRWRPQLSKRLARLAAPDATLSSSAADSKLADRLAEGLRATGFTVVVAPAEANATAMTLGRYAPRFVPSRPPARRTGHRTASSREALILGAGLAGCATASRLADKGWAVTLVDRHPMPAAEASGNAAGVFHGVVHSHDGHHARFNRAAALEAGRTFRRMLADAPLDGAAAGSVDGLLRLGSKLADLGSMKRALDDLRLPSGFVQAVDAEQGSMIAGIALAEAAWFYPNGGWMRPAWLASAWLDRAADDCTFIGGVEVDAIRHIDDRWVLLDRQGATIADCANLVLANASGAQRLLSALASSPIDWPLQAVRGQSSQVALPAGLRAPMLALSGAGYVLPSIDGSLVFGATAQKDDADPAVRASDHRENAERLAQLSASFEAVQRLPLGGFDGRTAWRCVCSDRLPLLGAVPDAWAGGDPCGTWDQPRFVPRRPGLFMFTGLGSRGITWSPLGAEVLASIMAGTPTPLEASLLDAIDPARFLSRANRRKAAADQAVAG